MMTTINARRRVGARAARYTTFCLLALLAVFCQSREARAQWATSGNATTTTNNVGVGTSTPSQMFHVNGPSTWAGTRVTTAGTGTTYQDGVNFGYDESYGAVIWNRESSPIVFSTGNLERMRLDAAGNLGLGVYSTQEKLGVRGMLGLYPQTWATPTTRGLFMFHNGVRAQIWAYDYPSAVAEPLLFSGSQLEFMSGPGPGTATRMMIASNGYVGIGTSTPAARLDVNGDIRVSGNINAKYQDVAEWVPTTQRLQAGTVVILDARHANHVVASAGAYDTAVAGVVSAQPGLTLGEAGEGKALVATTGRVKVRVDATRAPIRIGDLIVTSDVAGVAMKSKPVSFGGVSMHRPGTIIGKALEPLEKGTGEILVLLSLQ